LLRHSVSKLSSGDRQRVSLGRAIIRRPKAFLMDEPLGALDAEFRHLMCEELRDLHDSIGATTVYVTHDQLEAMSMADRIAVMNHGVVEQIAAPQELYGRPATMFVADFIGSPPMNLLTLEGSLRRGDRSLSYFGTTIEMPECHEDRAAGALAIGVRPEHVALSDRGSLRGQVFAVEYLGTNQIVTIDIARTKVKARLPSSTAARVGETVGVSFRSEKLVVFDVTTGRATRSALFEGAFRG
jgi:multiple sugar transport system ATP-binding protein